MTKLIEMDPVVSIRQQLGDGGKEPVILVNVLHAPPGETEALVAAWTEDARYFKAQPGFISAQLHRGIAGSGTFVTLAVWQDVAAFRAAFTGPGFTAKLEGYPEGATVCPHLFRKVAVDGVCVA